MSFESSPSTTSVNVQYLTGLREQYFTDNHFLVLGLAANDDLQNIFGGTGRVYVRADNLTNAHWENRAHPIYGAGTCPQPARSFLFGYAHDF